MVGDKVWWALPMAVSLCGCAHRERGEATAEAQAQKAPYRSVERVRRWYRPEVRCSNGPFELVIDVPPARWGAQLTVSAIAPKRIPAHLEIEADHRGHGAWRWSPADVADERCRAGGGEVVAVAPAATTSKPRGNKGGARPAAAAATVAPATIKLAALTKKPALPKEAQRWVIGGTFLPAREEMENGVPDLASDECWWGTAPYPTGATTVKVWFPVVHDLEDAAFEVLVEEVVPTVADEKFAAELSARKAHDEALAQKRREACRGNPRDAKCYIGCARAVEATVGVVENAPTAPPAPRAEVVPARPNAKAVWIAGSWQWNGKAYDWSAGFWRMPGAAAKPAATVGGVATARLNPRPSPSPSPSTSTSTTTSTSTSPPPPAVHVSAPPPPVRVEIGAPAIPVPAPVRVEIRVR